MSQIKKEDLRQEVFDLYDDYAHDRLDRREFAQKLSAYAVGGITVASLMSFLTPDYQGSIQVKPDDARIESEYITYRSPLGGGEINALLAKPAGMSKTVGGISNLMLWSSPLPILSVLSIRRLLELSV